jgi:hypothetical protein
MPLLVTLPAEALDVRGHLCLERRHQHPASAFPGEVIQAQPELIGLYAVSSCTTFSMGGVSFPPVAKPGACVIAHHAEGYAAFFIPSTPIHNFR